MSTKRRISRSINDTKLSNEIKQPSVIISNEPWVDNYFGKSDQQIKGQYTNTTETSDDDGNLEILLTDLRNFITKNGSIKIEDVTKNKVSQKLLNNKFFFDFDMDGEISFSDYNIAWQWVQQGKPTSIDEFAKNLGVTSDIRRIPYQAIQSNDSHILEDNKFSLTNESDIDKSKSVRSLYANKKIKTKLKTKRKS